MYEEIQKLEKQRMEYLEVNDKRYAKVIENKIKKIEQEIKLDKLNDIEEKLNQYEKFIKHKCMNREFENWCMSEFILKCARGKINE